MQNGILAIGASGTICLEVVKKLTEKGESVRVGTKNPDKAKTMGLSGVELYPFEYTNPDTFIKIFEGINKWFFVSPSPNYKLHETVLKVIDEAMKAGVKEIVNISMMGMDKSDHPFWIIENYIASTGLKYSVLRPNCYMQHFNDFLRGCVKDECAIRVPAGNARASFIDIRDVAEAAAKLLLEDRQKNYTYTLTGPKSYNMNEVSEIFSSVLGRKVGYENISMHEYEQILKSFSFSQAAIDEAFLLCNQVKKGMNSIVTADLQSILGREATSLEQFAKDYADQWK